MKEYFWTDKFPAGLRIRRLLATIQAELQFPQGAHPGHFYSPIPQLEEVERDQERIFRKDFTRLPEIDLQEASQIELLARLAGHAHLLEFSRSPVPGKKYYTDNCYFFLADAMVLGTLLLEFKPRRYFEIGSGFSSALTLDVNDRHFGGRLQCTFVEPRPARLYNLLGTANRQSVNILERRIQDLPDSSFGDLEHNDFLLVDGSHISKVGSDLNDIIFRILPLLKPGVLVHFHDIPWPFEYAKETVLGGISWNEAYLLRAFLANNSKYQIVLFPSWLEHCHAALWDQAFPMVKGVKSSSFWLRKN